MQASSASHFEALNKARTSPQTCRICWRGRITTHEGIAIAKWRRCKSTALRCLAKMKACDAARCPTFFSIAGIASRSSAHTLRLQRPTCCSQTVHTIQRDMVAIPVYPESFDIIFATMRARLKRCPPLGWGLSAQLAPFFAYQRRLQSCV